MRLAFLFLLAELSGLSASYYVDATGGNNANPGTQAEPWQTLAYVTNQSLTAGDSVLLKRGERWFENFTFKWNGVTLADYGAGALPIIDGAATNVNLVSCGTAINTITRNLWIINAGLDNAPLYANSAAGTNWIVSCVVSNHTYGTQGDCVAGGGDSHTIVSNCVLAAATDDGFTMHTTASGELHNCVIKSCASGINNSGSDLWLVCNDCTISNCSSAVAPLTTCLAAFSRCRFSSPIDAAKFYDSDQTDSTVFNYCTFDASAGAASTAGMLNGSTNTVFKNCVFYGNTTGNFSMTSSSKVFLTNCIFSSWWRASYLVAGGEFTHDHCIFNSVTTSNATTAANFVSAADPLFVAPASGNFQLQASSPAINAGVSVGLATDLAGNAVGNPPEVGAYEYSAPPSPPDTGDAWKNVTIKDARFR